MPFSIYCSGNDSFHYSQGHVSTIGDVFDIQQAMGRISGGLTDPAGTLRDEARDAVVPDYDALQAGLASIDTMTNRGLLDRALSLAMVRMSSLHISVSARNPGWITTDTAFATTLFYQGDGDCVFQFIRDIGPALEQTGLNGGAVLGQFARAIDSFDGTGCGPLPGRTAPADYMLIFQLSVV